MKTIYLDSDFKCHVTPGVSLTAVETADFDNKCKEFIEGFRFVPYGHTWVREDGVVFHGQMIAPWKPYTELSMEQGKYEFEQLQQIIELGKLSQEVGITVAPKPMDLEEYEPWLDVDTLTIRWRIVE